MEPTQRPAIPTLTAKTSFYTPTISSGVVDAIRLPEDIEARLTALAAKTGRTKTFYAKEAILEHIDDLEDKYLAANRLENPGKRWTLDDMQQDLDVGN